MKVHFVSLKAVLAVKVYLLCRFWGAWIQGRLATQYWSYLMELPFLSFFFQCSYCSPCHHEALKQSEVFTEQSPNICMKETEIFFNVTCKEITWFLGCCSLNLQSGNWFPEVSNNIMLLNPSAGYRMKGGKKAFPVLGKQLWINGLVWTTSNYLVSQKARGNFLKCLIYFTEEFFCLKEQHSQFRCQNQSAWRQDAERFQSILSHSGFHSFS